MSLCVTLPRQVLEDRVYMVTRRCAERRFFLRPCQRVEQAFVYCFAVAAQRYGVEVYWLSVLSNHHHDGIRDRRGNYPEFLRYFHSLLARCLNVHLGRWENFWSAEQCGALHLGDADAIFEKMIYALTNPVKDHLVDRVFNWPGFNSLCYQLTGKSVVAKRPPWFFDKNGELPDEVELSFARPPEFAHLNHGEWAEKIRTAVALEEQKAAEERSRSNGTIVGRKAILRQSPYSCPKTCTERRGLRPRVATRNKWRRIELLCANKRFHQRYREAFERRCHGHADVVFPYGTYQLKMLNLVRCQSASTLE